MSTKKRPDCDYRKSLASAHRTHGATPLQFLTQRWKTQSTITFPHCQPPWKGVSPKWWRQQLLFWPWTYNTPSPLQGTQRCCSVFLGALSMHCSIRHGEHGDTRGPRDQKPGGIAPPNAGGGKHLWSTQFEAGSGWASTRTGQPLKSLLTRTRARTGWPTASRTQDPGH